MTEVLQSLVSVFVLTRDILYQHLFFQQALCKLQVSYILCYFPSKEQWPNRNPFHIPLLFSEINQIYSPIHLVFCPFFTHRLSSNTIHKQMKRLFYLFSLLCVSPVAINYNLLSISSSDEYKSQYNLI